jgi:hypothetical protein
MKPGRVDVLVVYKVDRLVVLGAFSLHFDAVVPGLKRRFVEENLQTVREEAQKMYAKLLAGERRS